MGKTKKLHDPANDRYRRYLTSLECVKTSLKSITRNDQTMREIESIVTTINRIVIHAYQFFYTHLSSFVQ